MNIKKYVGIWPHETFFKSKVNKKIIRSGLLDPTKAANYVRRFINSNSIPAGGSYLYII